MILNSVPMICKDHIKLTWNLLVSEIFPIESFLFSFQGAKRWSNRDAVFCIQCSIHLDYQKVNALFYFVHAFFLLNPTMLIDLAYCKLKIVIGNKSMI